MSSSIGDGTPPPDPNRSTFYDNLKGVPPFFLNRRNRARNRAKTDKTQRNQMGVRQIKNAFKHQNYRENFPVMPDLRIDCGDRDTYASSKPMYRGYKKALREGARYQKLMELMDDQRCRDWIRDEAILTAYNEHLVGSFDTQTYLQVCDNADADYHRRPPVTSYVNRGPQSDHFNKTGRYALPV